MPELPEVEVVRRGLQAHVVGSRIESVHVLHPRAVRRQPGGAPEFEALLTGCRLLGTGRRGKFLWLITDDPDLVLAAHLGMSGQFRIDAPGSASLDLGGEADLDDVSLESARGGHRHARVRFELVDEQGHGRLLSFVDQRTFGWVAASPLVLDPRGVPVPEMVARIGPDPTEVGFDAHAVARRIRHHRVELKRLLLDQSLVSGIGNIYADEALWRARVHPRRRADRLSVSLIESVLDSATAVMAESLAAGGTSFDSLYVNVNGQSGYYGRGLAVYGRAGEPCARCGTPIQRERFTNRSSHFCPTCQRPPRTPH